MGNPVPRPRLLAKKLLAIREHLGLSQIRLVMRLGADISYHRVSEFEHGRRMPSLMVLLAYARTAQTPLENIVDDDIDLEAFIQRLIQ
jgi:transcriptional regulator with XRE-family HTH domain